MWMMHDDAVYLMSIVMMLFMLLDEYGDGDGDGGDEEHDDWVAYRRACC